MSGLFISFEGIDGVGKTTQIQRLGSHTDELGLEAVFTREPGGTVLGRRLRDILLHGEGIGVKAEALLFAADRAQDADEIVRPALARDAVVIADRYLDSSLAYQAGGRELDIDDIRTLSLWATGGLLPRRTYLLDMDPVLAHARLAHLEDRMESGGTVFQERTRDAFLALAAAEPERFVVVDAGGSAEEVWDIIRSDFDLLVQTTSSSRTSDDVEVVL